MNLRSRAMRGTNARHRHRVPSRWCHREGEDGVLTVTQLLECHHRQPLAHRPLWYRLVWYQWERAGAPRRVALIPLPRTVED